MKRLIKDIIASGEAKTVLELYEGHPERWHKGCAARDEAGNDCYEALATSVCISRACGLIHYDVKHRIDQGPDPVGVAVNKCLALVNEISDEKFLALHHWNDRKERTFEEVLELVRRAGV